MNKLREKTLWFGARLASKLRSLPWLSKVGLLWIVEHLALVGLAVFAPKLVGSALLGAALGLASQVTDVNVLVAVLKTAAPLALA